MTWIDTSNNEDFFRIKIIELDADGLPIIINQETGERIAPYYYYTDPNMEREFLNVNPNNCGTHSYVISVASGINYQDNIFISEESETIQVHILDLCNKCP